MSAFWTTAAAAAVACTSLVTLLVWFVVRGWRLLKRFTRFLDDYEGTPERPGVPARPGVMERLLLIELLVGDVHYELPRNGKPLAVKVDELYAAHQRQEEMERLRAAALLPPQPV